MALAKRALVLFAEFAYPCHRFHDRAFYRQSDLLFNLRSRLNFKRSLEIAVALRRKANTTEQLSYCNSIRFTVQTSLRLSRALFDEL